MTGVQLVVALILMGGVISYLGDKIGMRVGRKRLSLFGLRPRYSSVIVTIVTGTMIAATSLGVLMAASNDVRTALFRMKEIQTALSQTSEALVAAEDELDALKASVAGQRSEVAHIVEARDKAVAERDSAREEKKKLQTEIAKVTGTLDKVRGELEQSKRRVATLREMGETLEDSITKMGSTETKLRRDISILSEQYLVTEGRLRSGDFAYLKDELVAAKVLEGGGSQDQIEKELLAFLEAADKKALARGAHIDGKERAIELAKEEHFFEAVNLLTSKKGKWVVRAVATQNTVRGEPLLVYFHLFPEKRIFAKGETIAKRVLDGGRRDQEGQLLDLLDEVNRIALSKGMITTGDGQVGKLGGEAFVEALLQLRRLSGSGKVSAVAAQDIWNTKGPLSIQLKVEPEGDAQ